MIVNKLNKCFQIRSDKPNSNWLGEEWIIVDDGSELANKIIENYPYINLIIENDILIDVEIDIETRKKENLLNEYIFEIEELKHKLTDTDYQAIKYAERQISEEEYQPIKEQRQAWRDKINELEELITESEVE